MMEDFWSWLPKAYGEVGDDPVFTKYNMEVAFAAGAENEAKRFQDYDTALLRQALEALEEIHPGNMTPMAEQAWNKAIAALRERLGETK